MRIGWISLGVGFGAVAASGIFFSCGGSSTCDFDGTCALADAGDLDANIVGPDDGSTLVPGCEKPPAEDPTVIVDKCGVFVAPNGNDNNSGALGAPYRTIGKGILAAKSQRKFRVYICNATYAEPIIIAAAQDGVSLYGGLNCPGSGPTPAWAYNSSAKPIVAPPTPGIPLRLDSLTKPTAIVDIEVRAHDAINPGDSSVAAFVNASGDVAFKRVSLRAGKGLAGNGGANGANYDAALPQDDPSIAGFSASGNTGGPTQPCAALCANSVHSAGGNGGNGAVATPDNGGNGAPNLGGIAPFDGVGGTGGVVCSNGHPGATSTANASGGQGAQTRGSLAPSTGWAPAVGAPGGVGAPGQGGGGGGGGISATSTSKGGGGGGGCGGCGGGGGGGGQGGGSSVALLSLDSTIALNACSLMADDAGNGGTGGDEQVGQTGGARGSAEVSGSGCNGAAGGNGSNGGPGGGGAGGLSVGVLHHGTPPTIDGATLNNMATGTTGLGGNPGSGGGPSGKGIDGVAQAVVALP